MNEIQSHYDIFDISKFILAILVVIIHTKPFSQSINTIISDGVCRLAVPLFFIISSYLLFLKGIKKETIKKYCMRIAKLYIFWFVIQIPIVIYERFYLSEYGFLETSLRFLRSIFFTSTFSGSWYLTSSIFCSILLYYLYKLKFFKFSTKLFIVSIIAYLFCVFTSSYGNVFVKFFPDFYEKWVDLFFKPSTSIIAGIPYFSIGYYYAQNKNALNRINYIFFLVVSVLFLFEIIFVESHNFAITTDSYFFLLPTSACIFKIMYNKKITIRNNIFFRNSSTIIFFAHFIIIFILNVISKICSINMSNLILFLLVLSISLVTSIGLINLSKDEKFRFLKHLF